MPKPSAFEIRLVHVYQSRYTFSENVFSEIKYLILLTLTTVS